MRLNMDRQSKALYFSTIALLSIGLCFAVLGPLFTARQEPVQVAAGQAPSSVTEDPLSVFQVERAALREAERQSLRAIMEDPASDSILVADAGARLIKILNWADQELTIEGVLRARGYVGCVATVHQDSANILLRGDSPTQKQAAQILELVSRETGLGGGDIKIIPIDP